MRNKPVRDETFAGTYQRVRLWSGISSITLGIALSWAAVWLAPSLGQLLPLPFFLQIMTLVTGAVLLMLPLEILSGQAAEQLSGRGKQSVGAWFADWKSGILRYWIPGMAAAWIFGVAANLDDHERWGLLLIFASGLLSLGIFWPALIPKPWFVSSTSLDSAGRRIQAELESLMEQPAPGVVWIGDPDASLVSGNSPDFLKFRRIYFTETVASSLTPREAALMAAREGWFVENRLRMLVLGIAVGWLTVGLAMALFAGAGREPLVAATLAIAMMSTWSLVALFVWPTLNRRWSAEADVWLAKQSSASEVAALIRKIQDLNATDFDLGSGKTGVFHPIKPASTRVQTVMSGRPTESSKSKPSKS